MNEYSRNVNVIESGRAVRIPDSATDQLSSVTKSPRAVVGWYVAIAGSIVGIIIALMGAQIDGGAIAILGFAPLMWATK